MAAADDLTREFLRVARRQLNRDLVKIEKAVRMMPADSVWRRRHEQENSVGNLLLHLAGNVRQWIVCGVGGAADERDRDAEFAQRESIDLDELLTRLRLSVEEADSVLAALDDADLLVKRRIQVYDVTLMHAIYHCAEHFGGHTGQILWIAKNVSGRGLGFYDYLRNSETPDSGREP